MFHYFHQLADNATWYPGIFDFFYLSIASKKKSCLEKSWLNRQDVVLVCYGSSFCAFYIFSFLLCFYFLIWFLFSSDPCVFISLDFVYSVVPSFIFSQCGLPSSCPTHSHLLPGVCLSMCFNSVHRPLFI